MKIIATGIAGTLESSDVQVIMQPNDENGLKIELESDVLAIFGDSIMETVKQVCERFAIENAIIELHDKGAFDHVIRARVQAAAFKAAEIKQIDWERL